MSAEIKSKVVILYEDDEVCINMPGMKDFVSTRTENGKRIHMQKRLILQDLKEVYAFYRLMYPDVRDQLSIFFILQYNRCKFDASNTGLKNIFTKLQRLSQFGQL